MELTSCPGLAVVRVFLAFKTMSATNHQTTEKAIYIFQNLKLVVLAYFISVDANTKVDFLWVVVSIRSHLKVVHGIRRTLLNLFKKHSEKFRIKN